MFKRLFGRGGEDEMDPQATNGQESTGAGVPASPQSGDAAAPRGHGVPAGTQPHDSQLPPSEPAAGPPPSDVRDPAPPPVPEHGDQPLQPPPAPTDQPAEPAQPQQPGGAAPNDARADLPPTAPPSPHDMVPDGAAPSPGSTPVPAPTPVDEPAPVAPADDTADESAGDAGIERQETSRPDDAPPAGEAGVTGTLPALQTGSGPLADGAVIAGRYTVLSAITPEHAAELLGSTVPATDAELYAVDDRLGYERCWSCGSTNNEEQQRFCVDCGAPLQHRQLVLAHTQTPTGESEEFAESGTYFHLVHPRKQFGSTGVALEVGACSAEGPHHPNEDSYWWAVAGGCFNSVSDALGVIALADGMGGYAPGSGLISKEIVSVVGRGIFGFLYSEPDTEIHEAQLQAMVRAAIAEANGKVLREIRQHGEMGATLVVAVIHGQTAYLSNIGDSRAYYIAPSGAVTQITRDQSLIEQQVAAGLLSPDAVYTALGNNVILHAIGEDDVENALDWYTQPLEPGSRVLLCSDGYWKTMQHDVWDTEMAAQQTTLRDLARAMVDSALARDSDDNTTVVLVGID